MIYVNTNTLENLEASKAIAQVLCALILPDAGGIPHRLPYEASIGTKTYFQDLVTGWYQQPWETLDTLELFLNRAYPLGFVSHERSSGVIEIFFEERVLYRYTNKEKVESEFSVKMIIREALFGEELERREVPGAYTQAGNVVCYEVKAVARNNEYLEKLFGTLKPFATESPPETQGSIRRIRRTGPDYLCAFDQGNASVPATPADKYLG